MKTQPASYRVTACHHIDQIFEDDKLFSWLEPDGTIHPVTRVGYENTHDKLAARLLGMEPNYGPGTRAVDAAFDAGWARLVHSGEDVLVHRGGDGQLTHRQFSELKNLAVENGKRRIVLDNERSYRVIWSEDFNESQSNNNLHGWLGVVFDDHVEGINSEDVPSVDHSEIEYRGRAGYRFRWVHGNPATVYWTDDDTPDEDKQRAEAWLEKRGVRGPLRHLDGARYWGTWRGKLGQPVYEAAE